MTDAGTQMTQEFIAAVCKLILEEVGRHQEEIVRLQRKLAELQRRCSHPKSDFGFLGISCSVCGKAMEYDLPTRIDQPKLEQEDE